MHTRVPPGSNNDTGETLIELIIAIAIMGIAVVAIVGGFATSILMSDVNRKQATAGTSVRNYAEAVETYVASGNFNATTSEAALQSAVNFTKAEFTPAVTEIECWSEASNVFGACAAGSTVQRVTLTVASNDARTLAVESVVVVVRKP